MHMSPVRLEDLEGVFAVPPLARARGPRRSLDLAQNERIIRHLGEGGITRLLYGGNAFLYHVTLAEYEALLEWMAAAGDDLWMIPSVGPSFGRAIDQAPLVRRHGFPCAMLLPCADPRDAAGLEAGAREIADALGCPLILYLKEESNWGPDLHAGLDAVARLVDEGAAVAIKYAVVRQDPSRDAYLDALTARVDRRRVISGIGERPAVTHLREWRLPGFTTGSGCVAPALSQALLLACRAGDTASAAQARERFIPLEDLRDAWGPARVLHAAVQAAGIAQTGPIPPYVSALGADAIAALEPVARELAEADVAAKTAARAGE
jgi:dihydrodipicolinate synthase/N-acetylneuraminate lyase